MEKDEIEKLIDEFITGDYKYSVKKSLQEDEENKKFIYNEISFQHELGIFLREKLEDKYMVQFERNVTDFGYDKNKLKKSEIDIVLLGKEKNDNLLIELKFHTKKKTRYHDTTADCVKDIFFVYNIVKKYKEHIQKQKKNYLRFKKGYCITVVTDKNFYTTTNREKSANYYCFRNIENKFDNKVTYSGKNSNQFINIDEFIKKGYLPIRENNSNKKNTGWIDIHDEAKYYLVEI